MPVIVNDIAAQLIRVAAYGRNVEFGEEVFGALKSEMNYFGMDKPVREDAETDEPAEEFPEDLQCVPNVRTFTSMITLYGYDVNLEGVNRIWSEMIERGVQPNLPTYTSLINALHKVALRKRWKRTKTFAEISGQGFSASTDMDGNYQLSGLPNLMDSGVSGAMAVQDRATKQDKMIAQLEDSLMSPEGSDKQAMFDIPLGTLLLRYYAMRIRDTANDIAAESGSIEQINKETSDDIQRAMRVCLAAEEAGLKPDYRFHSALADLFDTCGDASGAELVRKHMGAMMDPKP
ncbi:hypothetical protein FBU59_002909 [Linderina macrospora]|uniref:Uncharacterized protein n=1 Tax=Linderina macrospora TaxID=4868 RepID=A0ACC1JA26_9FUNG|nr:hypothetical protein FBU59_002909 [Linderina macrospora]